MQDADAASKAVANPTPIIDGRKANVNLAYLGAKPRPKSTYFKITLLVCLGHTSSLGFTTSLVSSELK